ncbi:uridine diphosphate glucose pyrophosphatase-like [Agrilus planipennis]|uniref:Uridine diphosphate glucose pyrophosphatase NUDT14 n=1 Tax=Agrilus planipennis TaxID=224129 RepID=A0A1W4XS49_AGRPL|nr:uridine diphosphate glucose pyrophosphatase-like [Agrilus planipennis]
MFDGHHLCDISEVVLKPLEDSIYMKPMSMHFKHNGLNRRWDILEVHDSVAIIIYNTTRQVVVLVKQFRPAVYFNSIPKDQRHGKIDIQKYSLEKGLAIELCAGIVDKAISLEDIAKEEVLEECGYEAKSVERISSYRSNVGTAGSTQTLFYCEVTDEMKVHAGGGIGDESIEVVEMTVPEVKEYVKRCDIVSPPSLLYGLYWFLYNKIK